MLEGVGAALREGWTAVAAGAPVSREQSFQRCETRNLAWTPVVGEGATAYRRLTRDSPATHPRPARPVRAAVRTRRSGWRVSARSGSAARRSRAAPGPAVRARTTRW